MWILGIFVVWEYFFGGWFLGWIFSGSLVGFSGCFFGPPLCQPQIGEHLSLTQARGGGFLAHSIVTYNFPSHKKTLTLCESFGSYLLSFRYVASCSFTLFRNSIAASNWRSPDFKSTTQFSHSFPCVISFPQLSHG